MIIFAIIVVYVVGFVLTARWMGKVVPDEKGFLRNYMDDIADDWIRATNPEHTTHFRRQALDIRRNRAMMITFFWPIALQCIVFVRTLEYVCEVIACAWEFVRLFPEWLAKR